MGKSGVRLRVIGMDFRIFHILMIIGSGFLLYSALGIDDDERFVTGTMNMFFIHRYIGLIWGLLILAYAAYAMMKRHKTKILEPLSRPLSEQFREGVSIIGRYFFNRKVSDNVKRKMGRHNVLASYAFVMMVFGFILLGIGGIGMIISPEDSVPYEVLLGIHLIGVGFLSLFILAHFFAVINKANRPLIPAVFFHGKVSKEWAEESMPHYVSTEIYNGSRK